MRKFCAIHCLVAFILLFAVAGGLGGGSSVLAAEEGNDSVFLSLLNQKQAPGEELVLICAYPVLEGLAGDEFTFQVDLKWHGSAYQKFDLRVTGLAGWAASILGDYGTKPISAIGLDPEAAMPETLTISLKPFSDELPEPGEYVVTLEVSSDGIKETIELKAVVTAKYLYAFYTADGRLNTEVRAGEENHIALKVSNTGTVVIDKIALASDKPPGWSITFKPDTVKSLEPGMMQEVDAVIKPPRNTITGDYMVTMKAASTAYPARDIELRVTVLTPMTGLWVGIVVVLVVIAFVGVIFRRLGRR